MGTHHYRSFLLGKRTFSGLLIALILMTALYFAPYGIYAFTVLITVLMGFEWTKLAKISLAKRATTTVILTVLGSCGFFFLGHRYGAFALLFFVSGLSFLLSLLTRRRGFMWLGIGILYVGIPMCCLTKIVIDFSCASNILLWLALVVAGNDIGGYLVGSTLKGPKLVPQLSPQKTWSGFIGGIAFALGFSLIFYKWSAVSAGIVQYTTMSLLLTLLAVIGDLFESFLKRLHGLKDSGRMIPGHGGIFDRLDGVLFALVMLGVLTTVSPQFFCNGRSPMGFEPLLSSGDGL